MVRLLNLNGISVSILWYISLWIHGILCKLVCVKWFYQCAVLIVVCLSLWAHLVEFLSTAVAVIMKFTQFNWKLKYRICLLPEIIPSSAEAVISKSKCSSVPEVPQPELMLTTTRGRATVAGLDFNQEYALQVLVLNGTTEKLLVKRRFTSKKRSGVKGDISPYTLLLFHWAAFWLQSCFSKIHRWRVAIFQWMLKWKLFWKKSFLSVCSLISSSHPVKDSLSPRSV